MQSRNAVERTIIQPTSPVRSLSAPPTSSSRGLPAEDIIGAITAAATGQSPSKHGELKKIAATMQEFAKRSTMTTCR